MNNEIELMKNGELKIELMEAIEEINESLKSCVDHFIKIGFCLKRIKENKLYELLNYSSLVDFAKDEFSLSSTSVKNYISVANKFGDEQYEELDDKYKDYSFTQLVELLPVSDDIESYSPNMTVKEIRSQKFISQLTDYYKPLYDYCKHFLENYKNPNFVLSINYYYDSIHIYARTKSHSTSMMDIYFEDGYYKVSGNKYYELTLESFKEIFNKEFNETILKAEKEIQSYKDNDEKYKQEQINKLPENEKGISLEEKQKRIKERLDSEKINSLFKEILKNKKYEFHHDLPCFTKHDLLCFELFKKYNKLLLSKYKLIYELRLINEDDEYFIGIINGLKHYRIYDLRIDCYDYDKDEWIKIFDISDMIKNICNEYSSIFGRLFDANKVEYVYPYLSDFEVLIKKINDGSKEFKC